MSDDPRFLPNPAGLASPTGYSHVATGSGRLVFVAGQVALDAEGKLVGAGDPDAQAEQVFTNIEIALAAAGTTFRDVVKLTFFLTDASYLPSVRTVRDRYVDTANPPTSSAVVVKALVRPDFLLEVDATALVAHA